MPGKGDWGAPIVACATTVVLIAALVLTAILTAQ